VANLVTLAKAYAEAAGLKITTVGSNSTGTMTFFPDLESGKTSCTLRKYDLLTAWFTEKWPDGKPMPIVKDVAHYQQPEGKTNHDQTEVRRREGRSKERKKVVAKKVVAKSKSSVRAKTRRRA